MRVGPTDFRKTLNTKYVKGQGPGKFITKVLGFPECISRDRTDRAGICGGLSHGPSASEGPGGLLEIQVARLTESEPPGLQ